jgi:hypothetical protein
LDADVLDAVRREDLLPDRLGTRTHPAGQLRLKGRTGNDVSEEGLGVGENLWRSVSVFHVSSVHKDHFAIWLGSVNRTLPAARTRPLGAG